VHKEGVHRVEALAQVALDMVDGVDEARVHFDLASSDDLWGRGGAVVSTCMQGRWSSNPSDARSPRGSSTAATSASRPGP
jgi:hypothetical protein